MPFSRSLFVGLSAAFCLGGLAANWDGWEPQSPPLPRLPSRTMLAAAPPAFQAAASSLTGPWAAPPQPHRPKPAPVATAPKPPEPVPDQTSVRYLGILTREGEVKTYLFKYLPSGKALALVEGIENQGWTLTHATPQSFALEGPGGEYAVSR